jgi:hypothetical protein
MSTHICMMVPEIHMPQRLPRWIELPLGGEWPHLQPTKSTVTMYGNTHTYTHTRQMQTDIQTDTHTCVCCCRNTSEMTCSTVPLQRPNWQAGHRYLRLHCIGLSLGACSYYHCLRWRRCVIRTSIGHDSLLPRSRVFQSPWSVRISELP